MLTNEPSITAAERSPPPSSADPNAPDRVALLTERQRSYLRLVLQNRSSKEIAAATGSSHRAVDKQLLKANNLLRVPSRFDAARLLADHDAGVEPLPPATNLPVGPLPPATDLPFAKTTFPLPPPLPTAGAAANMLTWKQVVSWIAIISIATPLGLTAAGMAIVTLLVLLGLKPL